MNSDVELINKLQRQFVNNKKSDLEKFVYHLGF